MVRIHIGVYCSEVDTGAEVGLGGIDWQAVVASLEGPGWVRLQSVVPARVCAQLVEAAPSSWSVVDPDEGGGVVRQGGLSGHAEVTGAAPIVRSFAQSIVLAINRTRSAELLELPAFNHANWGRSIDGVGFITAHRDPPAAGGMIAITTLAGRARFRVWDDDGVSELPSVEHDPVAAHEWDTDDGDLVLLRGGGWPRLASRCPVHEVESPPTGDRIILTLRHNKGGYGASYFTSTG
jgi:hypothetical protein